MPGKPICALRVTRCKSPRLKTASSRLRYFGRCKPAMAADAGVTQAACVSTVMHEYLPEAVGW